MKQLYYRLTKLLKVNANYNILLGERSNGKSYAVKEYAIQQAWTDSNKKFAYVRRWDLEVKPSVVEKYFKDAPITAITEGVCDGVLISKGEIWLTHFDDISKKSVKVKCIGYTMSLSSEQHYTSGAYPDVINIIFEEFISRDYYLPCEPLKLMNLVSTIARRKKIQVFMIGNTISRVCPYFQEWQLVNTVKQKQGTIETYTYNTSETDENTGEPIKVIIAVEFCENSGRNSKMFFGVTSQMITSGAWQSKEMPHLPKSKMLNYTTIYTVYVQVQNFKFKCELLIDKDGVTAWYVTPKTTDFKSDDRIITDHMYMYNIFTTIGFIPLNSKEAEIFTLIKQGKIYYCDNLTGTDFETCLKQLTTM